MKVVYLVVPPYVGGGGGRGGGGGVCVCVCVWGGGGGVAVACLYLNASKTDPSDGLPVHCIATVPWGTPHLPRPTLHLMAPSRLGRNMQPFKNTP